MPRGRMYPAHKATCTQLSLTREGKGRETLLASALLRVHFARLARSRAVRVPRPIATPTAAPPLPGGTKRTAKKLQKLFGSEPS